MQNSNCKKTLLSTLLSVLVILLVSSSVATAATVTVDCSGAKAKIKTITAGLAQIPLSGPNTILVSGTCRENITIDSYELLTIRGNPTATLASGTDPTLENVMISNSRDVRLEDLTVTGGLDGIVCGFDSICRVTNVVVRDAADTGVYCGIASSLRLTSVTMENNGNWGLGLGQNANVGAVSITVRNSGGIGIYMNHGASLYMDNSVIQNNGAGGGIYAETHATLQMFHSTLSGNAGDGLYLNGGSTGFIGNSTIISNVGHGVRIGDLSFAWFRGNNLNVSGNGSPDVVCDPVYSATRGIGIVIGPTSGGTTNCDPEQPTAP